MRAVGGNRNRCRRITDFACDLRLFRIFQDTARNRGIDPHGGFAAAEQRQILIEAAGYY